jgi:tetratricopeptide (TPR) repeat protein
LDSDKELPGENDGQYIGHLADKCFQSNRPDTWRLTSTDGTDDVGLDFQVQIVKDNEYKSVFRLQLKGTKSPSLSANGDFYSVTLKRRTLNYYARATEAILLVLCDLSGDTPTKDCPCFYVWIHAEMKRHRALGKDSSNSDSLRVRVPTANRLTEDLDLLPELESQLRLHRASLALDDVVEQKLPTSARDDRSSLIENLASGFSTYDSNLLQVVASPTKFPWPQAPRDSFAGKLDEIDRLLTAGAVAKAQSHLDTLSDAVPSATIHEQAEYWYCKGRLSSWQSEEIQAEKFYDQACATAPGLSRYVVAWVEAHLAAFFTLDGPNDFTAVKARLTSDDPAIRTVFARILAAEGDYDTAISILSSLERKQALSTLAVVTSMSSRYEDVIALCDEALSEGGLESRHEQLYHLLRARAKFTLAMPEDVRNAYDFLIASATGPSTLNASLLRSAWEDIITTIQLMKAAGWPTNIAFVADIWVATGLMLGRAQETYELAKEAAAARPRLADVQKTVELFALNVEDYPTALAANER